jgi:signal transduction histidine kinase
MTDSLRKTRQAPTADLDQLGLAGVVREQARSLSASGVAVDVSCADDLAVGPAVEVAAYRIVTEAMTNVVRHAGASGCWVTIVESDGVLEVRVSDDGRGPATVRTTDNGHGVGLDSMRERADELGGTLAVVPRQGGGTTVHARIPVRAQA